MKIEKDSVVSLHYKMYMPGDNGSEELWEQTPQKHPLMYIHGWGMMLPAFEAALEGKEAGDEFDFSLSPDQAYGNYDETGVRTLAKKLFFNGDGEFDSERVTEGAIIPMRTEDGTVINAQVIEITDESVTIDLNHPYAGETLHFVGTIQTVRQATEQELDDLRHPKGCCGGGCKGKKHCKKEGDLTDMYQ
ncbi:MAG: peptidylprolyl isomerase [Paludibacteraceae bacterium]|nr:peptidylprolyl isomerase [Paludibacteraceae bacterium]